MLEDPIEDFQLYVPKLLPREWIDNIELKQDITKKKQMITVKLILVILMLEIRNYGMQLEKCTKSKKKLSFTIRYVLPNYSENIYYFSNFLLYASLYFCNCVF